MKMPMEVLTEALREEIKDAEADAAESHIDVMNSYGAGYDRGYADALIIVLAIVTGQKAAFAE